MEIRKVEIKKQKNTVSLEAEVWPKDATEPFILWFKFPLKNAKYLTTEPEPFIAALLIEAMYEEEDVETKGSLSLKLGTSLDTLMDYYSQGDPDLSKISVSAKKIVEKDFQGRRNAAFFSGGVDSFYTILKNRRSNSKYFPPIDTLIIVRGFDIPLDRESDWLWRETVEMAHRVGKQLGLEVIEVVTNVREHTQAEEDWRKKPYKQFWLKSLFGSLLASVALTLQKEYQTVSISSGQTYDDLFPNGSHPLLDPLWSTDGMAILHVGTEANRLEKIIREVSKSEVALNNLRVCWENRNSQLNCGECEKCLRTLAELDVVGCDLSKLKTFNNAADYVARLDTLSLGGESFVPLKRFWEDIAEIARNNSRDDILRLSENLIARLDQDTSKKKSWRVRIKGNK